jgi:spore protease
MQVKSKKFSTDMAIELIKTEPDAVFKVKKFKNGITQYMITRKNGKYCNIETKEKNDETAVILSDALKQFIDVPERILAVGLGNNRFVADSLGPKVCELILTYKSLVTFSPSISGITGIKSTTAVKAIADAVKPSHVIVIDTLCCHAKSRLGTSYQISNTGIQPGSGVQSDNEHIDRDFIGCPVIAVGVPLVIHVPKLHFVVPKNIDAVVAHCSSVIARAISLALGADKSTASV